MSHWLLVRSLVRGSLLLTVEQSVTRQHANTLMGTPFRPGGEGGEAARQEGRWNILGRVTCAGCEYGVACQGREGGWRVESRDRAQRGEL